LGNSVRVKTDFGVHSRDSVVRIGWARHGSPNISKALPMVLALLLPRRSGVEHWGPAAAEVRGAHARDIVAGTERQRASAVLHVPHK
jgi:hypothetical protein